MEKILSNQEIKTKYRKERNKLKIKIEKIHNDIEKVIEKFQSSKEKIGKNMHNLELINKKILEFQNFKKSLIKNWQDNLGEDTELEI